MTLEWAHPEYFLLLLLLPIVLYAEWRRLKTRHAVRFSSTTVFRILPSRGRVWLAYVPFVMRFVTLLLLIIVLARPLSVTGESQESSEGLDVVLVVDTSGSMRALDFVIDGKRRSRLDVVKKVLENFIESRGSDRIGMVVFGSEAFTQAPLTLDRQVLQRFLQRVEIGMAGQETAIGDAIATAVKRLKDVEAKSKVVILLTDGSNTAGQIDPIQAAEVAKTLGIKVYTIGAGSNGLVPMPGNNGFVRRVRVEIDENLLRRVAAISDGMYFRARDTQELVEVYDEIDKLEKTKIEVKVFKEYEEVYQAFLWPVLLLMLLEVLFQLSRFRRLPE